MSSEHRERALAAFSRRLELPPIARFVQRGRDPDLARYTLEFADGRIVHVGTMKTLWSQTEFLRTMAVAISAVPYALEAKEWRIAVRAIILHGTDVIELQGETYADTVEEWVQRYAASASTDRDGACAASKPFIHNGRLHIHAQDLARYVRREYGEQVRLHDLRQALTDLGYGRVTMNYATRNGASTKRSTASYYRSGPGEPVEMGEQHADDHRTSAR